MNRKKNDMDKFLAVFEKLAEVIIPRAAGATSELVTKMFNRAPEVNKIVTRSLDSPLPSVAGIKLPGFEDAAAIAGIHVPKPAADITKLPVLPEVVTTAPRIPSTSAMGPLPVVNLSKSNIKFDSNNMLKAIAGQESGPWKYTAKNKHSGALGKYQFMPGTVYDTAKSLKMNITPEEFYKSPELQELFARELMRKNIIQIDNDLRRYLGKSFADLSEEEQVRAIATSWYTGPGNVIHYFRRAGWMNDPQYYKSISTGKKVKYNSINDYVNIVNSNYSRLKNSL